MIIGQHTIQYVLSTTQVGWGDPSWHFRRRLTTTVSKSVAIGSQRFVLLALKLTGGEWTKL